MARPNINELSGISLVPTETRVSHLYIHDTDPDEEVHAVLDGRLYISSMEAAWTGKFCDGIEHEIRNVLNVATLNAPAHVLEDYASHSIRYLHVPINDLPYEDITRILPQCLEFLNACTSPALVHCSAGVSRSAAVIIAYLVSKQKAPTYESALALIRINRPAASPNLGFASSLRKWIAALP